MPNETDRWQEYLDQGIDAVVEYGPRLIMTIALLFIGLWLIKKVVNLVNRKLQSNKIDPSIAPFLKSLISAGLKVMLVIVVATTLGVETTSFVAVIGAATLAIGMALQGSLANFAGGVLILIFKPFKVGQIISAQGFEGYVEEIQVFKTTIVGMDRKVHIIPNGLLSNGTMSNYSAKKVLRVNMKAWVGYDADIDLAKKVALEVLVAHPLVEKTPAPKVRVFQLEKDCVVLGIHPYCDVMPIWDCYFEVQEEIVKAFQKHGISVPHTKLDVYNREEPTLASITS